MHRSRRIVGLVAFAAAGVFTSAAEAAGTPYIYAVDGNNIATYTASGSPAGVPYYSDNPNAMAFDASGNLFVSVNDDGYIGKYTPSGSYSTFAGPLGSADGLAFDASGNLYVAQTYGVNKILKYTPGGVSSPFASLPTRPVGLAFDAAGNLYTADQDNGTIDRITPGGSVSTFITGLAAPTNIAFDASGNLYVCNDLTSTGTVEEFSPGGTFVKVVASGLDTPYSLAFDKSGDLFIGNLGYPGADNGTIEEIASNGSTSTLVTYMPGAWALAIAPADALLPEPGTISLILCAAGTLILKRSRLSPPA